MRYLRVYILVTSRQLEFDIRRKSGHQKSDTDPVNALLLLLHTYIQLCMCAAPCIQISSLQGFLHFSYYFQITTTFEYTTTLQKKEVCAQRNVPVICFKICYISCIRKSMQFFSFFISCNFIFLPYECPGLCRHRPGHS